MFRSVSKSIVGAAMLLSLPVAATAQNVLSEGFSLEDKKIVCAPLEEVIKMTKRYGETPFFTFKGVRLYSVNEAVDTTFALTMNFETESWTFIEFLDDGTTCVDSAGQGFEAYESFIKSRGAPL
jgi:hypothetical protein